MIIFVNMKHDLTNMTALVTGGSSGIGLEYSQQLLARGCRVIIASNREQELAEARNADFRIREEVGRTICRIENTDAQDVIFMRYMKGMKWDEIAAEKIFSVQRVYQLRRIGIEEMERVIFGFAKD